MFYEEYEKEDANLPEVPSWVTRELLPLNVDILYVWVIHVNEVHVVVEYRYSHDVYCYTLKRELKVTSTRVY